MSWIDAFCEAALRFTPKAMDNLGIRINVADLPSWVLYRFCEHQKYGAGRLSRFWCRHLRPRFAPKRQGEIDIAFAYAQRLHGLEFMNAVLERGDK